MYDEDKVEDYYRRRTQRADETFDLLLLWSGCAIVVCMIVITIRMLLEP
jgi:hypothetical protein